MGDCLWNEESKQCLAKSGEKLPTNHDGYLPAKGFTGAVNCGKAKAESCATCPQPLHDAHKVWTWCSGECIWNEKDKHCMPRTGEKLKADASVKEYLSSASVYKSQE